MLSKKILLLTFTITLQTQCMDIEQYQVQIHDLPQETVDAIIYRVNTLQTIGRINAVCKHFNSRYNPEGLALGNLKITSDLIPAQHTKTLVHCAQTDNMPLLRQVVITESKNNKLQRTNVMNFFNFRRKQFDSLYNIQNAYQGKGAKNESYFEKAVSLGNAAALTILLLNNPDVDLNEGFFHKGSALTWATELHYAHIIRILLRNNCCSIDKQNIVGNTALHIACLNKDQKAAKLLIAHKCNLNIQNSNGNTPLHFATRYKLLSLTKILITQKADLSIKNSGGKTALDYLSKKIKNSLLEECGIEIKKENVKKRKTEHKDTKKQQQSRKKPRRK